VDDLVEWLVLHEAMLIDEIIPYLQQYLQANPGALEHSEFAHILVDKIWPSTRAQRCWVHKTANVLNKLPNSLHTKAKHALHDIWMAETRKDAETALDAFIENYSRKYDKAAECLVKDRDVLLAFYDFPAEYWKHLRTTNPIESAFATVRHRTTRSKGCLSNKTALTMIFKLAQAAEKSWRRLKGYNLLPKVVLGVKFNDGIEIVRSQSQIAAA
jgi:putative transposase